ncbi:endonuclease III domain-containing protein [Mesorhizobium retamae]|uniref:Endonuclease III domain-containing protein n=1 Tax=Mesorhizobium retamae TaxID=2912854 RepID=A0ABS9QP16_9HYPH|nr:endonuclease III domain-containing protein [Mesorhizobium sp. IRAMC:0171]MCG7509195.1 endonuclease III domain-containing protein [Mesorhizobium sp. IRAMC:0171]
MQQVIALKDGQPVFLSLPAPGEEVLPSVIWGDFAYLLTPAFWAAQSWMAAVDRPAQFGLGDTLAEEVVACLLGGYGAPAEVGLAAYDRVRAHLRSFGPALSLDTAEELLTRPLQVRGRSIRYRFAKQRARYLHACLVGLLNIQEDQLGDRELRDSLCTLPGVGPKTASWVVRNRRDSDQVAILDVHIVRACCEIGVFPARANPAVDYHGLEERYLSFSHAIGVRASVLDAVMWKIMRSISLKSLKQLRRDKNRGFFLR